MVPRDELWLWRVALTQVCALAHVQKMDPSVFYGIRSERDHTLCLNVVEVTVILDSTVSASA